MTSSVLNSVLIRSVAVASLGGLLFGFDTAVISGTTQALKATFNLSAPDLGVTVSIALWGTVVGAMTAGLLGRALGGRNALMIVGACYLLSALGCALSNSWSMLLVFRFLGGLGIGASSVIGPVYIAEVAPPVWRGRLVGAFQVNIVIGILVAYGSNAVIALQTQGPDEWRWDFGVGAVPATLFLLLLIGNPSSARWLALRNRLTEARATLELLGSKEPDAELYTIVQSLHDGQSSAPEALFRWRYRRPIALAVLLALFNQLVGINAVLYYLNDILATTGVNHRSQGFQTLLVGLTNLVATLIALSLIDRVGRRRLLLIGSIGLAVCLGVMVFLIRSHRHTQWLLLPLVAYVGFFAYSQGAVIWVYLSEIFPNAIRAQGQSLGSSTHWIANALVAALFPVFAAGGLAGPFSFFCAMAVLQFCVVLSCFPETRGVSLEAMHEHLRRSANPTGSSTNIALGDRR